MKIKGMYSFNNGQMVVEKNYGDLYHEVKDVIASVNANTCKTKVSEEKTMVGAKLFSPRQLNARFKKRFGTKDWHAVREKCVYPTKFYADGYKPAVDTRGAFREMDFIKRHLGIEVQFGKYAFMVYNVCAKMTIFHNLGYIDAGIEIVPVKEFADYMSTGVSYFEQFVWDLEKRGVSDIDIPVLILGIDK